MQRLKYSLLLSVVIVGIMLGLSWLQAQGRLDEKTFQYLAIGVAVVAVAINAVMRRKVRR
jgi:predicted tellurium resistance membrane protein TerC